MSGPSCLPRLAVLAALVCVALAGARDVVDAAVSRVTFRSPTGRGVNAFFVDAGEGPAPAVVVVPMLGRPKEDWEATAERLAAANIAALAIDLPSSSLPAEPKVLAGWADDIRGALTYLESRGDVRANALGVAGASLGASLAASAAGTDSRIRSLVLVSPALDYRGVRIEAALRAYGARPALLIASHQDPYAARSARELAKDAPGIRELQWSELGAHGTALLSREPDLVQALVDWFRRTLA